ncbi:hypothetical protein L917_08692 [Phytophthora nicotianae]|uniref:RxLR effector protein n=1 Tax=Phytophthora nicotianae TaxID=4792 RepID=W2L8X7_PHYNI|nr:hypothetical protein L917_08692 [Phytophthora nicotianae]
MRLTYVLVVICAVILQASSTALPAPKASEDVIKNGDSPSNFDGLQVDEGRRLRGFRNFLKKEFLGKLPWTKTYKQKKRNKHNAGVNRQESNIRHSGGIPKYNPPELF